MKYNHKLVSVAVAAAAVTAAALGGTTGCTSSPTHPPVTSPTPAPAPPDGFEAARYVGDLRVAGTRTNLVAIPVDNGATQTEWLAYAYTRIGPGGLSIKAQGRTVHAWFAPCDASRSPRKGLVALVTNSTPLTVDVGPAPATGPAFVDYGDGAFAAPVGGRRLPAEYTSLPSEGQWFTAAYENYGTDEFSVSAYDEVFGLSDGNSKLIGGTALAAEAGRCEWGIR